MDEEITIIVHSDERNNARFADPISETFKTDLAKKGNENQLVTEMKIFRYLY
jgi:hypothetical protein